jgi:hypothetical protein
MLNGGEGVQLYSFFTSCSIQPWKNVLVQRANKRTELRPRIEYLAVWLYMSRI